MKYLSHNNAVFFKSTENQAYNQTCPNSYVGVKIYTDTFAQPHAAISTVLFHAADAIEKGQAAIKLLCTQKRASVSQ